MYKLWACIIFSFISLYAGAQKKTEEKHIQETIITFFDALADLNNNGMKAAVTNDFTLVEHGLIWNIDSLINHLEPVRSMNMKRLNTINFVKTEQKGDVSWVVYYNTADVSVGDKQMKWKWLESALLVKQDGKWRLKLLHSTDLE